MKKISEIIVEKTKGLDLKGIERMALGLAKKDAEDWYSSINKQHGYGGADHIEPSSIGGNDGWNVWFTEDYFFLFMAGGTNDDKKPVKNFGKVKGMAMKANLPKKAKKEIMEHILKS